MAAAVAHRAGALTDPHAAPADPGTRGPGPTDPDPRKGPQGGERYDGNPEGPTRSLRRAGHSG